ncbi:MULTISPECIES: helix-turn-helix transcriptional regulator [unclassified Nonomuraea]|uniref:helix-turn-helix transcriptional regulator n=1 Tax=Nonomuraea sp. NPDC003804 TaxID=3154547 RepID=UPI0033B979CB
MSLTAQHRPRTTRNADRDHSPSDLGISLVELELAEQTRSELLVLSAEPDRMHPSLPRLFAKLARRRLAIRILHGPGQPGRTSPFTQAWQAGAMVHAVAGLPYQVLVRDRMVVYVPHPDQPAADRLERVANPLVAASVAGVFDTIHRILTDQQRGCVPGGQEEHEVLRALNDGLTDDRAAARLHLSKRTFARRVASVMENLNATSRFQAGAEAARRGWI